MSRKTQVERQCELCGSSFQAKPSHILRGHCKFCSRRCWGISIRTKNIQEHFWSKVDQSAGPDACWPWTAGQYASGYGAFTINGKLHHTNRLAFEFTYKISLGRLFACHTCDNPPCCNFIHIFPGTPKMNIDDASRKGRLRHGKNHALAKLNDDKVREIRIMSASQSQVVIAQFFDVTPRVIRLVLRGETWRHVI